MGDEPRRGGDDQHRGGGETGNDGERPAGGPEHPALAQRRDRPLLEPARRRDVGPRAAQPVPLLVVQWRLVVVDHVRPLPALPERAARARQAALRRAGLDLERGGNLFVREPFDVVEDDHLAMLVGQRREHLADRRNLVAAPAPATGGRRRRCRPLPAHGAAAIRDSS